MRNAAFWKASHNALAYKLLLVLLAQKVIYGLDGIER